MTTDQEDAMSVTADRHRIVPDPGRERAFSEAFGFDVEVHWTPDRDRTTVEFSTPDLDDLLAQGDELRQAKAVDLEAERADAYDDGLAEGRFDGLTEAASALEALADEVTDDLTPAQVIDLALAKVRDL